MGHCLAWHNQSIYVLLDGWIKYQIIEFMYAHQPEKAQDWYQCLDLQQLTLGSLILIPLFSIVALILAGAFYSPSCYYPTFISSY